jgi:Holliday junction resolvasome RuvABC DNA-binding subunit
MTWPHSAWCRASARRPRRLLIELKSRLALPDTDTPSGSVIPVGAGGATVRSDVRDALSALGYGADEIGRALAELPEQGESSELLRAALQRLAAA